MPDGKSDDDCPGCNVYPGKARHAFDAAENLVPIVFTGARVHILLKTGAPWALLERSPSRPSDAGLSWSAYSMLKVNSGDYLPNRLSLSTAHDVRNRFGCGSAMADLNLDSGNCNYEAIGRSANGRLDVSVNGHLVGWTKLVGSLVEIDCKYPRSTVSALVNPTTKECAFHCLQAATDRLSVGCELAFEKIPCTPSNDAIFNPYILTKYAGPNYLASCKFNPISYAFKSAYYHHYCSRVQVGTTIEVDPVRVKGITRLAFRVVSDTSVFRAAIDTDGVISSLWEKRFGNRFSVSLSTFLNHLKKDYGMGVGLSFE